MGSTIYYEKLPKIVFTLKHKYTLYLTTILTNYCCIRITILLVEQVELILN